jgi:membrane protease YdiL (CAAX protease family)
VFAVYAIAAGGAAAGAIALGRNPLEMPGWLGVSGAIGALLSAGLGTVIGAATVAATHVLARRAQWVRALHADLRPVVRGAEDTTLVAMAIASGLAEELLFRGLLTPLVGVIASSIAFGILHQVRGRARWGWMAWALVMGLLFATVFAATGSLVGPIIAHVYINAHNLRFLRDTDLQPKRPRYLGGLLGRH